VFDIGLDVLSSAIDAATGFVQYCLGDAVYGERHRDGAEDWSHVGFASRPPMPSPKRRRGAAQVVLLNDGGRDIVIASKDPMGQQLVSDLADGETAIYASGEDGQGQAKVVLKKDGSINLSAKRGNTSAGTEMLVKVDPTSGTISLTNDAGYGITIDGTGVHIHAGNATLDLASSGTAKLDGTIVSLGTGVLPALRGPTGILGAPSAKVVVE
jgi:phage gp45-like